MPQSATPLRAPVAPGDRRVPEVVDLSTRRVTVGQETYPKMFAAPPKIAFFGERLT